MRAGSMRTGSMTGSMARSMARSMEGSMAIVMAGSDQGSLVSSAKFKPSYNNVSSNSSMISSSTVFIGSMVIVSFFVIWTIHIQKNSDISSFFYYNFSIVFSLLLNVTPPLYFFNRLGSFKLALSIVQEIFIWNKLNHIGTLLEDVWNSCTHYNL